MTDIGLAGGTAGLGRALLDALLGARKHTVIVLSRRVNNPCIPERAFF